MDELELKTFVLGELDTNSYLIFDNKTKKGFIVDIPAYADKLSAFIRAENLDIAFILITHAHFDHIGGLDNCKQPFYIHPQDAPFLKNAHFNGSLVFSGAFTVKRQPLFYGNAPLAFESHPIEVLHTPGHTPGSVSLKLGNWLFSGDVIFPDSVGRTDIPLASHDVLLKSIKEKIFTLAPDTIIYPGHGKPTTVVREKRHNPFVE